MLLAKEERRQIKEKLEEATTIRRRLERESKDAHMKAQKAERKKERLEWKGRYKNPKFSRTWSDYGLWSTNYPSPVP